MDVQSLGCRLPPGLSLIKVASHQKEPKTPHEISATTNKIMNYPDWPGYLLLLLILTSAGTPERIQGPNSFFYVAWGAIILSTNHGVVMTGFYYYSVNHQSGLQRNTFSKFSYIYLTHQNVPQIMSFHFR